jgi:hypothetical protein
MSSRSLRLSRGLVSWDLSACQIRALDRGRRLRRGAPSVLRARVRNPPPPPEGGGGTSRDLRRQWVAFAASCCAGARRRGMERHGKNCLAGQVLLFPVSGCRSSLWAGPEAAHRCGMQREAGWGSSGGLRRGGAQALRGRAASHRSSDRGAMGLPVRLRVFVPVSWAGV